MGEADKVAGHAGGTDGVAAQVRRHNQAVGVAGVASWVQRRKLAVVQVLVPRAQRRKLAAVLALALMVLAPRVAASWVQRRKQAAPLT